MYPQVFFVVVLLAGVTLLMLGLGLFLPDATVSNQRASALHVYRLPQGSERIESNQWVWQNETVRGVFRVYSGAAEPEEASRRGRASTCCTSLGGRLESLEGYEIEAANDGSFTSATMEGIFLEAARTWEAIVGNVFGAQSSVSVSAGLVFNGRNQIGLGALDIDVANALAVTGLWMVCPGGGSVSGCDTTLEIVEWDQTYAIEERDWSAVGASGSYDLPSVAVHEFGHNVGLGDLTDAECSPSTMFGSSGTGETFRRSLDAETVQCVRDLYGIESSSASMMQCAFI